MPSLSRLILLLSLAALGWAPPALAETPVPAEIPLTSWEFQRDQANRGAAAGWHTGAWASDWQNVDVPHVFDPHPAEELFGGTIGWYRTRFKVPETAAGFGWAIEFEGSRRVTRVWLNGRSIGVNSNPYEPFTLPARNLRPGTNELVVRVHNIKSSKIREGWWNWGGLIRPVTVRPLGPVHYHDVGLLSDVKCRRSCGAIVRADGWLENRTAQTRSPVLVLSLTAPDGRVARRTFQVRDLRPGERRRVRFPMGIPGARRWLWSPGSPDLYRGFVEVREGAQTYQHEPRKVGLRYIRVQDGKLYLNGHRLQLRGASIQEDLPGRGPALRDSEVEQIVTDLKQLGANVTRAHYLLNDRLLERLDEEGILVWSQAPVYHEDEALERKAGVKNALRKVRGTVLAARNHPSVMTHSVANELSPYPNEVAPTRRFMVRAARLARSLDSTVPVSIDLLSYPRIPRQRAYAHFGLLGINSYYGWYRGKVDRSTERLSDLTPYLKRMRRLYPRQALMLTEFGAEATYHGPSDVKETYAFQANYLRRTLDIVDRLDWLSGAIYWTAREFYVKPDWDGGARRRGVERDALHNKGLIHYDGSRKPSWNVARARFTAVPWRDEGRASPARQRRR